MKKIMIDLDQTICTDFFIHMMSKFLGREVKREETNSYYIEELISKEQHEAFFDMVINDNPYNYVHIFDGATDVIKELMEHYECYICSSYTLRDYPDKSGIMCKYKFDWIRENLPFFKPQNIIFVTDKRVLDVDIRIDDKVSNMVGSGEMKLLFNAFHNKYNAPDEELYSKGIKRVDSWEDIRKILLSD